MNWRKFSSFSNPILQSAELGAFAGGAASQIPAYRADRRVRLSRGENPSPWRHPFHTGQGMAWGFGGIAAGAGAGAGIAALAKRFRK